MDTATTSSALRMAATVLLLAFGLGATQPAAAQAPAPAMSLSLESIESRVEASPMPSVRSPKLVVELTSHQEAMIAWAEQLYADAGLGLPRFAVSFPASTEPCHGGEGLWEDRAGEPDRVLVCVTHDKPHVQDEWQRRTLIHELAHAWAEANLTDADRERFMGLREVDAWNEPTDEWGHRGTEHAAEIISWGVIDQKLHLWKLPDASCPALTAGYELLTGMAPTTGLEESCR